MSGRFPAEREQQQPTPDKSVAERTLERAGQIVPERLRYHDSPLAETLERLSEGAQSLLRTSEYALSPYRTLPDDPKESDIRDQVLSDQISANLDASSPQERVILVRHAADDAGRVTYEQKALVVAADRIAQAYGLEVPEIPPLVFPQNAPVARNSIAANLYQAANAADARVQQLPQALSLVVEEAQREGLPDLPLQVINRLLQETGAYVPSYAQTYEERRDAFLEHAKRVAGSNGDIALTAETANILRIAENADEESKRSINAHRIDRAVHDAAEGAASTRSMLDTLTDEDTTVIAREATRIMQANGINRTIAAADLLPDGVIYADAVPNQTHFDFAHDLLSTLHTVVPDEIGSSRYFINLFEEIGEHKEDIAQAWDASHGTRLRVDNQELAGLLTTDGIDVLQTVNILLRQRAHGADITTIRIGKQTVDLDSLVTALVDFAQSAQDRYLLHAARGTRTPKTDLQDIQALISRAEETRSEIAMDKPAEFALNILGTNNTNFQAVRAEQIRDALAAAPRSWTLGRRLHGKRAAAAYEAPDFQGEDPFNTANRPDIRVGFTIAQDVSIDRAVQALQDPQVLRQVNLVLQLGTPQSLTVMNGAHGETLIRATYYNGDTQDIPLPKK